MNKVKISNGLAVVMLLASVFAGWQTMLILIVLLFAFCDVNDTIKNTIIAVVTFRMGVTIVNLGWDVIKDFASAALDLYNSLVIYVEDYDVLATLTKISGWINTLLNIADDVIKALITLTEIGFVVAIFVGKNRKQNFVSRKIDEYVSKAVNYINNLNRASEQPVQTQTTPTSTPTNITQ